MYNLIGASGFIGTRLCKRLSSKGTKFKIIDKSPSAEFPQNYTQADVRNPDALEASLVHKAPIVNLAAEHRDDVTPVSLYDQVNVQGAENICAVAEKKEINTIIFTSTVAVYGESKRETGEEGSINYFNEYGRTKYNAENIYKNWQKKDPLNRTLVIIRPTVVFGEGNRGNVYNLFKQIASRFFLMVGNGKNIKSMAYVENVAAFIEHSLTMNPGIHLYNYVDKPDFDMNTLIVTVKKSLGKKPVVGIRLPYFAGITAGIFFDFIGFMTGKKLPVSYIRIKKFCMNSCFQTAAEKSGFIPPFSIEKGLENTISYDFINNREFK